MDYTDTQKDLEQQALSAGIERYHNHLKIQGAEATRPGQRLMSTMAEPLAVAITEAIKLSNTKHAGRQSAIATRLAPVNPGSMALLTCRCVLQAIGERKTQVQTSKLIGQMVAEHDSWTNFMAQAEFKGLGFVLTKNLKTKSNERIRRNMARNAVTKYTKCKAGGWTGEDILKTGRWLLEMLLKHTNMAVAVHTYSKRKTLVHIAASPLVTEMLAQGHAMCEELQPVYKPMVVKPVPWTTPTDGGYLTRELQVMKVDEAANGTYIHELNSTYMPEVYKALNAIQDTAYRVNKGILGVLQLAVQENSRFPSIPNQEQMPLPAKPANIESDAAIRKAYSVEAATAHEFNAVIVSSRIAFKSKLTLANDMKDFPELYFPHTLDWRGRAYPVPVFLQPQGDDTAKALLQFAEGKPLGAEGLNWLKVHVANLFGVDKVSFEDRIQWVDENLMVLIACGMDPMTNDMWRTEADAKHEWQALAACMELAGAMLSADPAEYVSHLPIAMDGSCNGLQNLSAMLLDEVGGKSTNLLPADKPADIYTEVADRVIAKLEVLAAGGDLFAQQWLHIGIARKLVKRPVMTKPYGVTSFGMRDQIKKEILDTGLLSNTSARMWVKDGEKDAKGPYNAASYLAPLVSDAIGECVVASKEVMDWLQDTAKVAAAAGLPLKWTTPVGLPVMQDYRKSTQKVLIATVGGVKVWLKVQQRTDKIDVRRQAAGLSPNVVHSLDAAHMMKTVNLCVESGIHSFAMVHDSYATHAADVSNLSTQLRYAFYEMYSHDVLGKLASEFTAQVEPEVAAEFPEAPSKGNLNLELVQDSLYFFA